MLSEGHAPKAAQAGADEDELGAGRAMSNDRCGTAVGAVAYFLAGSATRNCYVMAERLRCGPRAALKSEGAERTQTVSATISLFFPMGVRIACTGCQFVLVQVKHNEGGQMA